MRSMGKKSIDNQFLKMASSLMANRGLVTLLTLGFFAAFITFIWALYTVYGKSSSPRLQPYEESTSTTTTVTTIDHT